MTGRLRARRLLGQVYRSLAAPAGRRALDRMIRGGLPPRLSRPIRYLFTGTVPAEAHRVSARIERRRQTIAARPQTYGFAHATTPHGPARWPVVRADAPDGPWVSSRWLAKSASIPRRWGLFLHLCAAGGTRGVVLEFGSCVGIASAYLGSARGGSNLMTLEGSPDLTLVAQATLDELAPGATVITGVFDEGLDRAFARLDEERSAIDVAYIDGHHDEAATLHYASRLVPRLQPEALLILDDIYLYEEMWRAWRILSSAPGYSAAVNLGRFGVLVRNAAADRPRIYDLARYTGWWRVGRSRYETRLGES